MKKRRIGKTLSAIFLGKRYSSLTDISDQVKFMTLNAVFIVAIIPLVSLGLTMLLGQNRNEVRAFIDFFIAFLCVVTLFLLRSKIPLRFVPLLPVTVFGAYCLYLLYWGDLFGWAAVWLFAFPPIAIFCCGMAIGIIESGAALVGSILFLYTRLGLSSPGDLVSIRIIGAYILIMGLTIIYERISVLKERKENALKAELAHERDIIQTMKDNIQQGIFLMDKELKILPQYSLPLLSILSYYDEELAGKNFLDILETSLNAKQREIMKSFFAMVFEKKKSAKVLESANPISEFEYKVEDRTKTLATKFSLVEEKGAEPVIIGIIQDITKEKEFEKELQAQKEAQEQEMKNMFDVIQIDPLVFKDFIEDTEMNFDEINSILKDRTLTERQVVTRFFENIHAIKSNALILGLDNFANKLHALEDNIKKVSAKEVITVDDTLGLALILEQLMQEKDYYIKIVHRIQTFKVSNQMDSILVYSLMKAVEKTSAETKKKVTLQTGEIDMNILESKLRKPIKDILLQCIRNAIYHGIEPAEERKRKKKNPNGRLAFSVKEVGGNAEIIFSDDGRGLNWEKIKAKYLKLHPGQKDASRKELLSAIFSPEFSTSEETTSVAGRGVGLSLVKEKVKENGGTIKVGSSDAGLTFKFVFPMPQ